MDYCTGHANAFGTSLSDKNLIELINLSNSDLANYDFTPCHKVDFIWEQDEDGVAIVNEYESSVPETGEGGVFLLYLSMLCVSCGAIISLAILHRKNESAC